MTQLNNSIFSVLLICLALKVQGGTWDWRPRCEEPWTAGQWRDALQKAAASALQRDPSYVRYNLIIGN